MNIKQVTVAYQSEQDRLLMRFNADHTVEFRVWLTRRFTLALLPVLRKAAGDQLALLAPVVDAAIPLEDQRQRLLEQFRKEELAYAGDFKTPYVSPPGAAEAGTSDGEKPPLLVTEVKITVLKPGQLQMQLSEKLPGRNSHIDLMMDAQMTQGLLHLLTQALKSSQWLEDITPLAPQALPAAGSPDAEESGALPEPADRPKYLN